MGYAGSATCDGDEKTEKRQLAVLNQQFNEMGNYGTCIFCGKEIPERLEAAPEMAA